MKNRAFNAKKFFALLLAVAMIFGSLPISSIAVSADEGTFKEIRTIEDLYNVRDDLTANYKLMNDIDLTEATAKGGDWDFGGNGWNPIGSKNVYGSSKFSGIFDGNGHKITGMRIEVSSYPSGVGSSVCVGLFSHVSGTVKNLTITGSCACVNNKTVFMGPIAATVSGTLLNCRNEANVTTVFYSTTNYAYIGGICGGCYGNSLIEKCCNVGDICEDQHTSNNHYAGGICGYCESSGSDLTQIIDCYNSGKVSSYYGAGGILAYNKNDNKINIMRCYNVGEVNGRYWHYAIYRNNCSNCYYLSGTGLSGDGATSLTPAQMKLQSMYKGFDFDNVWTFDTDSGYEYPQLQSLLAMDYSKIEVSGLPFKCSYLEGEEFDEDGLEVTATKKDGTTSIINSYTVSGYDSDKVGKQVVTVSFIGMSDSFEVNVIPKTLTDISIVSVPNKCNYLEGEELDSSGLKIKANYNNGTSEEVSDYTISGYTSTPGTKTVIVDYLGKQTSFQVSVEEKQMTSIEISALPNKIQYLEGDELNTNGLVVTAHYNNGATQNITNYSVTGYTTTPGDKKVIVSSNGKTASFNVTVVAKTLSSIKLLSTPAKLTYLEAKEELDVTGGQIQLLFNNGTTQTINITNSMVSGFNNARVGKQRISVTYEGFIVRYDVEIIAKTLDSITVSSLPYKTVYYVGDAFEQSGMTVTANYNNGTSQKISGFVVNSASFSNTAGEKEITVTYGGKTAVFKLFVYDVELDSIYISRVPNKLTYNEGENLNLNGLEVYAKYSNGTENKITDYLIAGYSSTPGSKIITVSYNGKVATFEVNVRTRTLSNISITSKPFKLEYHVGDIFEPDGLIVTAHYDNGTSETITDYDIGGFSSTAGTKTIMVSYMGKTATFAVTVKDKSLVSISVYSNPTKTNYIEGKDNLDLTGGKIKLSYADGSYEIIDMADEMVSGFDNLHSGTSRILVSYFGKTTTFNVTIEQKTLAEIKVTKSPDKTVYYVGQNFEKEGMTVTAYYNNGTYDDVLDYSLSSTNFSTAGNKSVVISYGGKTTTFAVVVYEKSLESIYISKLPSKLIYLEGEQIDTSDLAVTAVYNNGTKGTVSGYTVSGYINTPGVKKITVSYNGKTATFEVEVLAKYIVSISVVNYPAKMTYLEGETFDKSGMVVKVVYNNGTEQNVTDYTVYGKLNNVGTNRITVEYNGYTAYLDVNVIAKTLVDITVIAPAKTVYEFGEKFDSEGLIVFAKYDNGTVEEVRNYTLSKLVSTSAGTKTMTVTYKGISRTFDVIVNPKAPVVTDGKVIVSNNYTHLGEEVSVSVSVSDNPGICSFRHVITFDPANFKFNSVTVNPALNAGTSVINTDGASNGEVIVVWFTNANITEDIELYSISLTTLNSASEGASAVNVSYETNDNGNEKGESVILIPISGDVDIRFWWTGDLDGDKDYSMSDLIMLAQYIAGKPVDLNDRQKHAADVNEDGLIDVNDLTILSQMIVVKEI